MYFDEHAPPHFHARYGRYRAKFGIHTGEVLGEFPPRAIRLVREWARQHEGELLANWTTAQAGGNALPIEPLE